MTGETEHRREDAAHGAEATFDEGSWDEPGRCECGGTLPPQREWHDAPLQWAHVRCPECQTLYVCEDSFYAVYPPDHDLWTDCSDRECRVATNG